MKIVFLSASYGTLYLMFYKFKPTYDHNHDSFRYFFYKYYVNIICKLNIIMVKIIFQNFVLNCAYIGVIICYCTCIYSNGG